jgi:hypothetical protein
MSNLEIDSYEYKKQHIDFRLTWEERKAIKCYPDFEREDSQGL